jgi:hypothetical protein
MQALVPRADYAVILEDLMWRAAFRADAASFERGVRNHRGRDALERRLALLRPLASGSGTKFASAVRDALAASPSETLRFLDQLVQRLELEDGDVRADHLAMLESVRRSVAPLADPDARGSSRTATALLQRIQAVEEGVGALGVDVTARARALAPTAEVYVGSVRLAPADPLPWPFPPAQVTAPSIFAPIELTPVEWRGPDGQWVFGWSVGG